MNISEANGVKSALKSPARIAVLAGAAGILALAIVLLILDKQDGQRSSASAVLHARMALAEPGPGGLLQISVIDTATGERTPVGEPDNYSAIAWSPGGSAIAALAAQAGPGDRSRLHLIDPATAKDHFIDLPLSSMPVFPAWSPDGSRLALSGAPVYMISDDGTVLSEVLVPAGEDGGLSIASGGFSWSPDSRYFGTVVNGAVVVVDASGSAITRRLRDLDARALNGWAAVLGWTPAGLALEFATPQGAAAVEVRPASGTLTASEIPDGQPLPTPLAAREPGPEVVAEARRLVPGSEITRFKLSATSTLEVLELRPGPGAPGGPGSSATVLVRDAASGAAAALPLRTLDTRGGWLYDVFP